MNSIAPKVVATRLAAMLGDGVFVEADSPPAHRSGDCDAHLPFRCVSEHRILEFSCGRLCARRALQRAGASSDLIGFGQDRCPVWPIGATGSISHTQGCCVAAVTTSPVIRAVGVDVEVSARVTEAAVALVATGAELTWLAGFTLGQRAVARACLFSAKEATYKCHYNAFAAKDVTFSDFELRFGPRLSGFVVTRCLAAEVPAITCFVGACAIYERYTLATALMKVPRTSARARLQGCC